MPKSMIFGSPERRHDVRGLDVAVTTATTCASATPSNGSHNAPASPAVHRPTFRHDLVQSAPPQVLQRDVEDALLDVAADVVNDHDAGVREAGRDARLGQEALLVFLALLLGRGQRDLDGLDRDVPAERGVFRFVHDAHGAAPELLADLVAADARGCAGLRQSGGSAWRDRGR
jgi:hypothetical protein